MGTAGVPTYKREPCIHSPRGLLPPRSSQVYRTVVGVLWASFSRDMFIVSILARQAKGRESIPCFHTVDKMRVKEDSSWSRRA